MIPYPRHVLPLVTGFLLIASAVPSRGTVIGTSSLNPNGSYTYLYVVNNTAGSFDISLWSLEFDFLAPDWNQLDVFSGGGVAVPSSNWFASAGIPVAGMSAQDFLSLSPQSDVLTGTSLSSFAFTSWFAPGTVIFNEFDAFGAGATSGTTVGPSKVGGAPVPEGAGPYVVIAGFTLAGLVFATRREKAVRTRSSSETRRRQPTFH